MVVFDCERTNALVLGYVTRLVHPVVRKRISLLSGSRMHNGYCAVIFSNKVINRLNELDHSTLPN